MKEDGTPVPSDFFMMFDSMLVWESSHAIMAVEKEARKERLGNAVGVVTIKNRNEDLPDRAGKHADAAAALALRTPYNLDGKRR